MIFFIITTVVFLSVAIYLFIPFIKHKTQIRNYHSNYLLIEEKPDIEILYVDRMGNRWAGFKDPMKTPTNRALQGELFSQWSELCMTPDYFAVEMNKGITFLNKGRNIQAGYIFNELMTRSRWAAHKSSLELLANVLFMLPGENPMHPSDEFMQKKKDIWAKDPDCEAFFLHLAFGHIRHLHQLSKKDFMNYLVMKELEEKLTRAAPSLDTF